MFNGSHSRRTGRYFDGVVERTDGQTTPQKKVAKKMHKKKQRQHSKKLTEGDDE